jgi:AraC-like DNA-binding protein
MLLKNFRVVDTRDPEELRVALVDVLGAHSFSVAPNGSSFEGRAHHCKLQNINLSYCYFSAPVALTFAEDPWVRMPFCVAGSARIQVAATEFLTSPDRGVVLPAFSAISAHCGEGYEVLILRVSAEALTRKLAAVLGAPPSRTLVFDPNNESKAPDLQHLRRVTMFAALELDTMGGPPPRSLAAELEQLLLIYFLLANRHNYSELIEQAATQMSPRQVTQVEDFIAASWNQPITMEALVAVTGASARTIFKTFRQSRGYSPMAFLKQVRLDHARRMLLKSDSKTSVTAVALACGFHNLGHFARDYRARFGELPSETLGRRVR